MGALGPFVRFTSMGATTNVWLAHPNLQIRHPLHPHNIISHSYMDIQRHCSTPHNNM